jgi:hypothetical protein
MIPGWLATDEARRLLSCHSDFSSDGSPVEQAALLARACEWFGLPVGSSSAQLEERVWVLWCDPSQWKRQEKRRLKDEWKSYFHETCGAVTGEDLVSCHDDEPCQVYDCERPKVAAFNVDQQGSYDQALTTRCWTNHAYAQRCWLRVFVPDNDLADNYRLEVITTPEDDAVVGWTVITD